MHPKNVMKNARLKKTLLEMPIASKCVVPYSVKFQDVEIHSLAKNNGATVVIRKETNGLGVWLVSRVEKPLIESYAIEIGVPIPANHTKRGRPNIHPITDFPDEDDRFKFE